MNLINRCKQFANSIKEIKGGGYRYSFNDEIIREHSSEKSMPKRIKRKKLGEKATIRKMIEKDKEWNKHTKELKKLQEDNPDMDLGTLASIAPAPVLNWKYKPATMKEARNAAIVEYNKVKFPPPDLDEFEQCLEDDEETEEEEEKEEEQILEDLEEMLRPMYNDFKYSSTNSGYLLASPFVNFFLFDILKIAKRPETKRYYVIDYPEYGAYHYPKRTYFKTLEEKKRYSPIRDWTMPAFDFRSLFNSDGTLNFDNQPPPWQLPIPFALGLPHLDDVHYGMRMNDVCELFNLRSDIVTLYDVHRKYRNMWERNVFICPYIARIALNARLRAEVNLRGPNPYHQKHPWHDFAFQFAKLKYHLTRLFASNGQRNMLYERRQSFPAKGCGKMYRN